VLNTRNGTRQRKGTIYNLTEKWSKYTNKGLNKLAYWQENNTFFIVFQMKKMKETDCFIQTNQST